MQIWQIVLLSLGQLIIFIVFCAYLKRKYYKDLFEDDPLGYIYAFVWPLTITVYFLVKIAISIYKLIDYLSDLGVKKSAFESLNERLNANTLELSKKQKEIIKEVQETDPIKILFEIENQELKSKLIEEHGFENLIKKVGYKTISKDDFGELICIHNKKNEMDYYYVKVINGTPESDGSFKEYFLKVPPDMDTAKEAVAWTYKMTPDKYNLSLRT